MKKIIVVLALLTSGGAIAQALPPWSIELFCAQRSKAAGPAMNDLFGACVDVERASLGELKNSWSDYSPQSRKQCISLISNHGLYSDLEACIEGAEALRSEGR